MQIMRTIIWVSALILVLLFILFNVGNSADLNVWPQVGNEPPVIIVGPIWAFALGFFLLGLVPVWLLKRAQAWGLRRRIASLENSLRAASAAAAVEVAPTLPEPSPEPETRTEESKPADVS